MLKNLFKRKPELIEEVPANNLFKPVGEMSARVAVLVIWPKLADIFSLRQVTNGVHIQTGVMHLSTSVSAAMRLLRKQGKINYRVEDMQLSSYRKL
jgi:hypothetical protein